MNRLVAHCPVVVGDSTTESATVDVEDDVVVSGTVVVVISGSVVVGIGCTSSRTEFTYF
jgi:hypothetical protein